MIFIEKAEASAVSQQSRRHPLTDATIAVLAAAVLFLGIMPQTLAERILASLG
jgi:hypothetical protein